MSLTLQAADLTPIVAQVLGKPSVTLTEWRAQPLSAGGSQMVGGLGIQRVTGVVQTDVGLLPWSLILKALRGGGALSSDDPGTWHYWQREAFAYQSGLLAQLPGGIVAIQRPFNEIVTHYTEMFVFLFALGDEACALAEALQSR